MKIIHKDLKKGTVKVKIEDSDDLWYLSNLIDPGDFVKSRTVRKIKVGGSEEKSDVKKINVLMEISVEKIEFSKTSASIRISGRISQAPEDIPRGIYHTISAEQGTILQIIKPKWLNYQLQKLNEAAQKETPKILICVMDRETAMFALMKKYGFEVLTELEGDVEKKSIDVKKTGKDFYSEIISLLKEYSERYKTGTIIIGSPSFWKENLMKEIKDDALKKRIILATCSSVTKTGINEILKRPELKEALKHDRAAKEMNAVEEVLSEISKNGAVTYGIDETERAAFMAAVKILLVTDSLIMKLREQEKYARLENIMKIADNAKAEVVIVSAEHEGGKKLNGLGGIAALLRWKIDW